MSQNKKRFFVEAINKAAIEQGIQTTWLSDNWICELKKGDKNAYVYGFNFSLNSATSWELAKDKAATSQILTNNNISCIEHKLFIQPNFDGYLLEETHSKFVFEYAHTIGYPLVCKDNYGAAGENVFKVNSQEELQVALESIWKKSRGASLCPYYDIEYEYRFFILKGEVQFVFKKVLGSTGGWKLNLNKEGVVEYETLANIKSEVVSMAIQAADALDLNSNSHLVLEINTSITTEHFSQTSDFAKNISLKLYSNILKKIFS
jgi:glutathione synthase/RimK-type ligase-like ATP-grasp enzyme